MRQRVSIFKIAGESARLVLDAFRRWDAARGVGDDEQDETCAEHWPAKCRTEMDLLALQFDEHAPEPPIVFFCKYADMWSMADIFINAFPAKPNALHVAMSESAEFLALRHRHLPA